MKMAMGRKDPTYSISLLSAAHLLSYSPSQDPIPGLALCPSQEGSKSCWSTCDHGSWGTSVAPAPYNPRLLGMSPKEVFFSSE